MIHVGGAQVRAFFYRRADDQAPAGSGLAYFSTLKLAFDTRPRFVDLHDVLAGAQLTRCRSRRCTHPLAGSGSSLRGVR
jgi:hypothetical protein